MNTEEYLSQLLSGELCPCHILVDCRYCIINDLIKEIENFCNIMGWTKEDFLLEIKYYDYEKINYLFDLEKFYCNLD